MKYTIVISPREGYSHLSTEIITYDECGDEFNDRKSAVDYSHYFGNPLMQNTYVISNKDLFGLTDYGYFKVINPNSCNLNERSVEWVDK